MAKQNAQATRTTRTPSRPPRDFPAMVVTETSEAFDAIRAIANLLASQDPNESVVGDDDMQWVGSFLRGVANAGEAKWKQELSAQRGTR